ncbi:MAG: NlpC/P60 family protein, partial [Syntrophothermus sp.]
PTYGLVATPVADLRADTTEESERVTQAILGTPVEITGESGKWWRVKLPSQGDYPGWIKKTDVVQTPDVQNYWKAYRKVAVVIDNFAPVRAKPAGDGAVVESLPIGSRVGLLNGEGGGNGDGGQNVNGIWYKVSLPGGRAGWVAGSAVQLVPSDVTFTNQGKYLQFGKPGSSLVDRVIATSRRWLGADYVWGGMSPRGFDCSGFTYTAYWLNGIVLPRDADQQFAATIPVKKEEMRPGDLVFFSTYGPGPTHVGIYLGDGSFINAKSTKSGVVISRLDEPYFAERFLGARRPFDLAGRF